MIDEVFRGEVWELTRKAPTDPLTYKDIITTKDTIVFINTLRDSEVIGKEVVDFFKGDVDDCFSMWVKWETKSMETPFNGKIGRYQMPDTLKEKPIIACDYHHVVAFKSSKEGMLKYIEYEVNKRIKQRKELENSV